MIHREHKTFGFCCGLGGGAICFKKLPPRWATWWPPSPARACLLRTP